jgi:hypothetical protein
LGVGQSSGHHFLPFLTTDLSQLAQVSILGMLLMLPHHCPRVGFGGGKRRDFNGLAASWVHLGFALIVGYGAVVALQVSFSQIERV